MMLLEEAGANTIQSNLQVKTLSILATFESNEFDLAICESRDMKNCAAAGASLNHQVKFKGVANASQKQINLDK